MMMRVRPPTLAFAVVISVVAGCQKYHRCHVEIRDTTTHAPVAVEVDATYSIFVTLARAFSWGSPSLKPDRALTDVDGQATLRVADDEEWTLSIRPPGEDIWIISFDFDLQLESGHSPHEDGWITARSFFCTEQSPPYEVRLRLEE